MPRQNEEALLSGQLGTGKGWEAGGYRGQERQEK